MWVENPEKDWGHRHRQEGRNNREQLSLSKHWKIQIIKEERKLHESLTFRIKQEVNWKRDWSKLTQREARLIKVSLYSFLITSRHVWFSFKLSLIYFLWICWKAHISLQEKCVLSIGLFTANTVTSLLCFLKDILTGKVRSWQQMSSTFFMRGLNWTTYTTMTMF